MHIYIGFNALIGFDYKNTHEQVVFYAIIHLSSKCRIRFKYKDIRFKGDCLFLKRIQLMNDESNEIINDC